MYINLGESKKIFSCKDQLILEIICSLAISCHFKQEVVTGCIGCKKQGAEYLT